VRSTDWLEHIDDEFDDDDDDDEVTEFSDQPAVDAAALATLQEMILAVRAAGDVELADWLASIAGDPETVAQMTGTDGEPAEET
jgi:hypothetical protein